MTTPNKRWRAKNPEKVKAHGKVLNALRRGRIKRKPCEKCGRAKATAHHEDYSKPLDVTWLCARCHRQLHAARDGMQLHPPGYKNHGKRPPRPPRKPVVWPGRKQYQPAPKRDALLAQAKQLAGEGKSYQQIAAALGVSKGTVYKWLNPKSYD